MLTPSAGGPEPSITARDHSARLTRWALIAIFVLALAIRFGWLAVNSHSVPFAGLAADNGDVARNAVVHGKWFVYNASSPQPEASHLRDPAQINYHYADTHPVYRQAILEPPGVPVVLAGVWFITGDLRFVYLQALQLLIDSCMVLLVYWLTVRMFHRRSAGLLAALLYALYFPAILLARIPHDDAWAGWVTIGALAMLVKSRESRRPVLWLVAIGVLLGLGAYFRPNVLLLPLGFALVTPLWSTWRNALRVAVVPLLVAAVILAPFTIRNYKVFHSLVLVRTSLGWTMWVGLGEVHNDFGDNGTDLNAEQTERKINHDNYEVGSPKFDKVLEEKSISEIEAHPVFYLELVGRRLLESTVIPAPSKASGSSRLTRVLGWAIPLVFILALISAIVLWRRRRDRRWAVGLLASVAVVTVVPFAIIHIEARFLVATAFVYLILASVGLTMLWDRLSVRSPRLRLWRPGLERTLQAGPR